MNFINTKSEALKKLYNKLTGGESPHYTETKLIDDIANAVSDGSIGLLPKVTSEDIGKSLFVDKIKSDNVLLPTVVLPSSDGSSVEEPFYNPKPDWFVAGKELFVTVNDDVYPVTITESDGHAMLEIQTNGWYALIYEDGGGGGLMSVYSSYEPLSVTMYDSKVAVTIDEYSGYDAVLYATTYSGTSFLTWSCVKGSWQDIADKLDALADGGGIDDVPSVLVICSSQVFGCHFKKPGVIFYYAPTASVPFFSVAVVDDSSATYLRRSVTWYKNGTLS